MSKKFLAGFSAGRGSYELVVDNDTNESLIYTVQHDVQPSQRLYNVNQGGWCYNKAGGLAGRFRLSEATGNWYYTSIDLSLRMNTKYNDIYEAQADVFKRLISQGVRE